uniref:Secreted protein n=1 Tax=Syphacia muris TaxID=451379 RepID=A0A0N5ADP1_9BILA
MLSELILNAFVSSTTLTLQAIRGDGGNDDDDDGDRNGRAMMTTTVTTKTIDRTPTKVAVVASQRYGLNVESNKS